MTDKENKPLFIAPIDIFIDDEIYMLNDKLMAILRKRKIVWKNPDTQMRDEVLFRVIGKHPKND